MTLGPLVAAAGTLWLSRIGPDASYLLDVLAPVVVFGLGLTLIVAPLTATVLDSAPDRYAGAASGVNNAVARTAGLLAVAVVPAVAGIGGADYTDPGAFRDGFHTAMLVNTALLLAGGALAFLLVRRPLAAEPVGTPAEARPERLHLEDCPHCGVCGPQLYPRDPAPVSEARG